jgi:hypothetical protein
VLNTKLLLCDAPSIVWIWHSLETEYHHELREESVTKSPSRVFSIYSEIMIVIKASKQPFGTIKAWMVSTRFLTRTLNRVGIGMSLAGRRQHHRLKTLFQEWGVPGLR